MTKFTKFTQAKLSTIQNFLLHIGSDEDEQLQQQAIDYVSEDHVDGEGSDSALLEMAMTKLILNKYPRFSVSSSYDNPNEGLEREYPEEFVIQIDRGEEYGTEDLDARSTEEEAIDRMKELIVELYLEKF